MDSLSHTSPTLFHYGHILIEDDLETIFCTNGLLTIRYSKKSGCADYAWDGKTIVAGAYSSVRLAQDIKSVDLQFQTFGQQHILPVHDAFGSGLKITFVYTAYGHPTMQQHYTLYENRPFFLLELEINDSTVMHTNDIAPLVTDTVRGVSLGEGNDVRVLLVPFDNNAFVRYRALPINETGVHMSSEVTAVYENVSRNGLVVGSVTHDLWKTGIEVASSNNNLDRLRVFGGLSSILTQDSQPHGNVSGTTLRSPKLFLGYYSDYRDGLEEFGRANATLTPMLPWAGNVPFGWNSWAAYRLEVTMQQYMGASDFYKQERDSLGLNNDILYVNWDAGWSKYSDAELMQAAAYILKNGQRPGIYLTPFSYWFDDLTLLVEGTGERYKYNDLILRDEQGSPLPKFERGYALDPTHPGTKLRIGHHIAKFKQWGYEYIKLDFLTAGSFEGKHFDTTIETGIAAYNQGMHYLCQAIAGSMFISLSIAPLFPSQYAHSRRISCDAFGTIWDTEYMLNSLTYGWWINNTLYRYNDPDHIVTWSPSYTVPTPPSPAEARSRVNSAAIAGTIYIDSDAIADDSNAQQRVKEVMSNPHILELARKGKTFRPIEGNTNKAACNIFVLHDDDGAYIAVFNFQESTTINVPLERAGLDSQQYYHVNDLWSGVHSEAHGTLSVSLDTNVSTVLYLSIEA